MPSHLLTSLLLTYFSIFFSVFCTGDFLTTTELTTGLHSADEHLADARRVHADERRRVKAQQGVSGSAYTSCLRIHDSSLRSHMEMLLFQCELNL